MQLVGDRLLAQSGRLSWQQSLPRQHQISCPRPVDSSTNLNCIAIPGRHLSSSAPCRHTILFRVVCETRFRSSEPSRRDATAAITRSFWQDRFMSMVKKLESRTASCHPIGLGSMRLKRRFGLSACGSGK